MPNKGRWERARCQGCDRTIACSRMFPWPGPSHLYLRHHRVSTKSGSLWCSMRFASLSALLPYRLTEGKR